MNLMTDEQTLPEWSPHISSEFTLADTQRETKTKLKQVFQDAKALLKIS